MPKINLIYISLSGNTKSFIQRLQVSLNNSGYDTSSINIKDLVKDTDDWKYIQTEPYIAFVPTYLDGGNGHDSGTTEILTTPLREFMRYESNYKQCLGIVGSGNKNFNDQYCLTAKQYRDEFNIPMIGNFELRGLPDDIEHIKHVILDLYESEHA